MKKWISFSVSFCVLVIGSIPISYIIHKLLHSLKKGKSFSLNKIKILECWNSLFENKDHQLLFYFLLVLILAFLGYLIFIVPLLKSSKQNTQVIAGTIRIPARAGNNQHGSAKFIPSNDFDKEFEKLNVKGNPLIEELIKRGRRDLDA